MRMEGRCRDLLTKEHLGDTVELRYDQVIANLSDTRIIEQIDQPRLDLSSLVGAKGGGHLRGVLDQTIHEERVNGSPLYLLLDDISGASLVSGWAWSRWEKEDGPSMREGFEERRKFMENVCHGFATGHSPLASTRPPPNNPEVVPLAHPQDDLSWHQLPQTEGANFRRARYIDISVHDNVMNINVGFQDSASDPSSARVAIHEYRLHAQADIEHGVLTSLTATPHILPFVECPGAIANISSLIGTPLHEMRTRVIEELPGVKGCTHLNDVLRGLAEAPILANFLNSN